MARLQKDNKEITNQIAGYLSEPHFSVRLAAIFALGARGDVSAVPALEALLKSNDLSIEIVPMVKDQMERLKNPGARGGFFGPHGEMGEEGPEAATKGSEDQRLTHLEQLVQEMNERLKSIQGRLPPAPKQ